MTLLAFVLHIAGGISGVARISRHLWRMCLGLTLALGSGLLLIFWLIRVRMSGSRYEPRQTTRVIG